VSPGRTPADIKVPRWRIGAAIAVLTALLGFGALFAPIYINNLRLQSFVAEITQSVGSGRLSDDSIRAAVVDKANGLNLPVKADNVHIRHLPDGTRVDVRYFVRVSLPGYTVDLHFYPGAGSR
jgi:hypothetical protein